jgi:hypothetical protein
MRQKQKNKDLEEQFYNDWDWVSKVINSCNTIIQLLNANKLRIFLDSKYTNKIDKETRRRAWSSLFYKYLDKYDEIKNS